MSFNRRGGPDRRPDRDRDRDRHDRPARRPSGDWPPRDDRGGDRPAYPPRDRPQGGRYGAQGGGDRPYQQRPRYDRPPDEGAMSIRLDPRRANALKHLAGEAGVRPGDLVRQWVEERIDASRTGAGGASLADTLAALTERVTALEAAAGIASAPPALPATEVAAAAEPATEPTPAGAEADAATTEPAPRAGPAPGRKRKRIAAARPSTRRVPLHDAMIEVIRERGPLTAGELATAIVERSLYTPPRSGKPLDAAMVSQRVSNPTYRSRFTRDGGRIGLAATA
jgi:hypothetical protein